MSSAAFLESCSLHRLVRDFKETLRNPVPDCVLLPEDDDMYVWHGNVRSNEGCLSDVPIHFMLIFPRSYPSNPPECRLFQKVPHPNVQPAKTTSVHGKAVPREARWRLALWDCVPDTSTWSSAYTVSSILLQLQAFLLIEDMADYASEPEAIQTITKQALEFCCPHCPHCPKATWPSFFSEEARSEITAAARSNKTLVTRPEIPTRSPLVAQQLREHQQATAVTPATALKPAATSKPATSAVPSTPAKAVTAIASGKKAATGEEEWHVVGGKKAGKAAMKPAGPPKTAAASSSGSNPAGGPDKVVHANTFSKLGLKSLTKLVDSTKQPAKATAPTTNHQQACPPPSSTSTVTPAGHNTVPAATVAQAAALSKAAKKNLARKLKKQQQQQGQQVENTPAASPAPTTNAAPPSPAPSPAIPLSATTSAPASSLQSPVSISATISSAAGGSAVVGPSNSTTTIHSSTEAASSADSDNEDEWTTAPIKSKLQAVINAAASASGRPTLKQQVEALLAHESQSEIVDEVMDEWHREVEAYKQQHSNPVAALLHATTGSPAVPVDQQQGQVLLALQQPMGLFSKLGRDDLLTIMCLLQPNEVAALACTCKGLQGASKDGALWQALLRSHHPGAQLAASCMSDWQHAYVLEANNVLDDLKCFYTRVSFEEDVLCLPLSFTVNPRTGCVDYIEAHPDLISFSAFQGGVTRTSTQESIQAVLPLYLTAEHFARAQPHYARVLRTLAPEAVPRGGGTPPPACWLDVLGKVLNTAVVLVCDQGVAASQKALTVYVAVHRLLLALCETHNLWAEVRRRLDLFLSHPDKRSKEACPNLGLLLPLLSLSRSHTWQQLAVPLLEESLARGVMWMCKAKPGLEALLTAPRTGRDQVVQELLQDSWQGSRVSTRLMMFHLLFLRMVGAPAGCSLETVMSGADALYGHPGNALATRFLRALDRIMNVGSWREYYSVLGLPPLSDAALTAVLKGAWARSCKRGYTYKGMDYSRIQSSGVSKILLKGQTYSAPPKMKQIELQDCWKWKPNTGTKFLDASILLYNHSNGQRTFLEALDFSHCISHETATRGAVTHSGDIMDSSSGTHKVQIDLKNLGARINEIFVVVSAWAGATLSEIVQPFVSVQDPATGMTLCEYHLEDQPERVRSTHSSVIMARIYRVGGVVAPAAQPASGSSTPATQAPGSATASATAAATTITGTTSSGSGSAPSGSGSSSGGGSAVVWKVQALGVVGKGCAGSYDPIQQTIEAGLW